MRAPVFLDDRLVNGWMTTLLEPTMGRLPANLVDRWRSGLLAAVQEAREPAPIRLTGRFAPLDRYLTGVAAGIAAGLGTSPASDAGDSDPIILAAGLLAGSAALEAATDTDRFEISASRAAAAAVVDAAADGAGLTVVIQAAARAATHVRPRALVSIAVTALAQSLAPGAAPTERRELYEVRLLLEPVDPADDLDILTVNRAIDGLAREPQWIPEDTGYRLTTLSSDPGPLIEAVWSYGRVSELSIHYQQ